MPRIDSPGDAKTFTSLGASSAYWQMSMSKEDLSKTAFTTLRHVRNARIPTTTTLFSKRCERYQLVHQIYRENSRSLVRAIEGPPTWGCEEKVEDPWNIQLRICQRVRNDVSKAVHSTHPIDMLKEKIAPSTRMTQPYTSYVHCIRITKTVSENPLGASNERSQEPSANSSPSSTVLPPAAPSWS